MSWETASAVVLPLISGVGAWYASRRTTAAKARALELKNTKTEVDVWRDLVVQLKELLTNRDNELAEVKAQLAALVKLSNEQTQQIVKLEALVSTQSRKIAELKRSIK